MNLKTKIPFTRQQHSQIDYDSKLLLLGSCFSENIGEKFSYFKFQSVINPFGILFHPLAIENLITRSINQDYYSKRELYFHNEQWFCLDAHSKLNNPSSDGLLKTLNTQIDFTSDSLTNASHIIITLGTSWVYRYISTDTIVANCHKLPQKQFLKELLSVNQIAESLEAMISLVREINPSVSFLFTVSPVRHLKDGFVENTQSKSHLLAAVHQVVDQRKQLYYFPSYEIMMDELRDYRFYKDDMLHPSKLAIDIIWDRFKETWLTDDAKLTSQSIESIQKREAHKPFNKESIQFQEFKQKLQADKESMSLRYPHILF